MTEDPVVVLPEAEYRRVWDHFYAEFNFQPSTSPLKWPATKEPVASATWSLATLPDEPDYERLDRLVEVVELGLASCVGPQDTLFALDWAAHVVSLRPARSRRSSATGLASEPVPRRRLLHLPLGRLPFGKLWAPLGGVHLPVR